MIYIEGNVFHKCLLSLPDNYSPERNCPLVVGLHGGAGNPETLITLWDHFPDRSFMYAALQAPYALLNEGELGFDWAMWPTGDHELISKATELSEKYIKNAVLDLTRKHNIDKVYLMGFSQGAVLTYLVGMKYHYLFSGLICLSGPGLLSPLNNPFAGPSNQVLLTDESIQRARELRVLITHGNDDQAAPYGLGIKSRDILLKHGYDVTFIDFEGGHSFPPKEILAQIVEWIKIR